MVVLGIKAKDTSALRNWISDTRARLEDKSSLARNPFTGFIKTYPTGNGDLMTVMDMKPTYPNVSPAGAVLAAVFFIFGFPLWTWLFVLPFAIVAYIFTPHFYFMMFKLGVKKAGYTGKSRLMKNQEVISVLAKWTNT